MTPLWEQGGVLFASLNHSVGGVTPSACAGGMNAWVGWPAHYTCPDGYLWLPPTLTTASDFPGAQQPPCCVAP